MRLGDTIASVATPIARTLNLNCIDPETNQLRPESPCAKKRDFLNDFSDSIFDRFWNNNKKELNVMEEEIMFQLVVVVKAQSLEDALTKYKADGKVLSGNPRPQQTQQPMTPMRPTMGGK